MYSDALCRWLLVQNNSYNQRELLPRHSPPPQWRTVNVRKLRMMIEWILNFDTRQVAYRMFDNWSMWLSCIVFCYVSAWLWCLWQIKAMMMMMMMAGRMCECAFASECGDQAWFLDGLSCNSSTGLTLSPPIPLRLYTLPYWSKPPFLIFDIWALWRSVLGLGARAPKCQKLKWVRPVWRWTLRTTAVWNSWRWRG